jgi:hypothetical protein
MQAYRDSRHHVVYEDGQVDVGIIDGRNLWLLEDDKWIAMKLRWKDEDVQLAIDRPSIDDKPDGGETQQRDNGEGNKPSAPEAKDDVQNTAGAEAVGGFMIGCDNCGTGRAAAGSAEARARGAAHERPARSCPSRLARHTLLPPCLAQTSGILAGAWTSRSTKLRTSRSISAPGA